MATKAPAKAPAKAPTAVQRRSARRTLILLVAVPLTLFLAVVAIEGNAWYAYATTGEPYEELGIDLNSRVPGPLRRWACARIAQRHPNTLPPSGCTL